MASGQGHRAGALDVLPFNAILEVAPWRVIMQQACGSQAETKTHIHIKEVRAQLKALRRRAKAGYVQRQFYGLDIINDKGTFFRVHL